MTIKITCPCGGTVEANTKYYDTDIKITDAWLERHQPCVNEMVFKQHIANKKASLIQTKWPSGFKFVSDENFSFHCNECGYAQDPDLPDSPYHADDCSHYEEK